ncbi:MAG: hypothetical protein QNJ72_17590 [Pleurocapsa sp. MO_226.B13]|nr:hypothetical protein [Pleurocapsa sp. MO_226.B13]
MTNDWDDVRYWNYISLSAVILHGFLKLLIYNSFRGNKPSQKNLAKVAIALIGNFDCRR